MVVPYTGVTLRGGFCEDGTDSVGHLVLRAVSISLRTHLLVESFLRYLPIPSTGREI
jgi:hypothetical protein